MFLKFMLSKFRLILSHKYYRALLSVFRAAKSFYYSSHTTRGSGTQSEVEMR